MSGMIVCSAHGETRATFVCRCVYEAFQDGEAVSMVTPHSTEEDPWPDAWCETCEDEFQRVRETLTDGFTPPSGLVALCTECYGAIHSAAAANLMLRTV